MYKGKNLHCHPSFVLIPISSVKLLLLLRFYVKSISKILGIEKTAIFAVYEVLNLVNLVEFPLIVAKESLKSNFRGSSLPKRLNLELLESQIKLVSHKFWISGRKMAKFPHCVLNICYTHRNLLSHQYIDVIFLWMEIM